MGDMADSARQFSEELADSLGLNAFEIRKNIGVLYNMTTAMGINKQQAYRMSTAFAELGVNMSSFYNLSHEEAFNKIASGLTGETEPLSRIGVLIKQNALEQEGLRMGIRKSFDTWTEQEKILVRYYAAMRQTKNSHEDLARTLNSPANQMRRFKTQVDLATIHLGRALLVIRSKVMPTLIALAKTVAVAMSAFANFMQVLFGVSTKEMQGLQEQSKKTEMGIGGVGDAVKEANKKVKGSVAGFDEINQLQEKMADSAAGAGTGIGGFETPDIGLGDDATSPIKKASEITSEAAEKFKKFFNVIIDNKENVIAGLTGITTAIVLFNIAVAATKAGGFIAIIQKMAVAIGGILGGLSAPVVAVIAVIAILAALITKYFIDPKFKEKVDAIWNSVKKSITKALKVAWDFLKDTWGIIYDYLEPIFTAVGKVFTDIWNGIKKIGEDAWNGILEVWNTVKKALEPAITEFGNSVKEIWNALRDAGKEIWEELKKTWEIIEPVVRVIIQAFADFITETWERIKELGISLWDSFKEGLDIVWKVVKPVIEEIGSTLEGVFKTAKIFILGVIESIKTSFKGILTFIQGVFTQDWKLAWEGVKEIFSGIFNGIISIFRGVINFFIDGVNLIIRTINRLAKIKVPDWVPGAGGKSFSAFKIQEIGKLGEAQPTSLTSGSSSIGSFLGQAVGSIATGVASGELANQITSGVGTALLQASQFAQQAESGQEVKVNIDGTELIRMLIPKMNQEQTRLGTATVITTQ
jgi:phage-related protein